MGDNVEPKMAREFYKLDQFPVSTHNNTLQNKDQVSYP